MDMERTYKLHTKTTWMNTLVNIILRYVFVDTRQKRSCLNRQTTKEELPTEEIKPDL